MATVWLVEKGEYEQAYIAEAFATKADAEKYVALHGGDIVEREVRTSLPSSVPLWHGGAHVLPDGTVEDWLNEHEKVLEGEAKPLERDGPPFDGHAQGHCGWHVSVFGTDRERVKAKRDKYIAACVKKATGTCAFCGKTERYQRNFELDHTVETFHYVGGPYAEQTGKFKSYKNWGPTPDGILALSLKWSEEGGDDSTQSWYGPVRWDGESSRWVRVCSSTKPVEKA